MLVALLLALTGALIFPAAAGAASRGFDVYNLSGHPIKLLDVTPVGTATCGSPYCGFEGGPPIGAVLQPGMGDHYEVTYHFGLSTQGDATYAILGDNGQQIGTFVATMQVYSVTINQVKCATDVGNCSPESSSLLEGSTVILLDPPGTVHDVPAGQGQAQAAVLKQYCVNGNFATCVFTATSESQFEGAKHFITSYANNDTKVTNDFMYSQGDTVQSSNSLDLNVTAGEKLFDVVDASINGSYHHTWSESHSYTVGLTIHCPPVSLCSIYGIAPMLRDIGDFKLTLGNTTWNLYGVYFDSPVPSKVESFSSTTQPLTSEQRKTLPPGLSEVRRVTGPYRTPARAQIVRPRLRLAIVGPLTVTVGLSARYRIILSRTQPDNQLVYSPENIEVLGTHAGRRVGHWRLSTLPRGKSRTLSLRLPVPSGARNRFCLTVSAAAKHARSTRTRVCAAVASSRPPASRLG